MKHLTTRLLAAVFGLAAVAEPAVAQTGLSAVVLRGAATRPGIAPPGTPTVLTPGVRIESPARILDRNCLFGRLVGRARAGRRFHLAGHRARFGQRLPRHPGERRARPTAHHDQRLHRGGAGDADRPSPRRRGKCGRCRRVGRLRDDDQRQPGRRFAQRTGGGATPARLRGGLQRRQYRA